MKKIINYIIIAISGVLVGRYVLQPKPTVQIKEVVKYVKEKEKVNKKNRKIVVVETKKPDGSSTKETVITEGTETVVSTTVNKDSETNSKTEYSKGITFGVLAVSDVAQFRKNPDVGFILSVPVIGNLSFVTTGDTSKRIGVGLSLEF